MLDRLGYDANGEHKDGRSLIFVGDLVDRGPDSVGVVNVVRRLVENGKAQCILGNHELNLLLGKEKHGNAWFFGNCESICRNSSKISYQNLAPSDLWRAKTLDWLSSLPFSLERKDLRVVHACWDNSAIIELERLQANLNNDDHFHATKRQKLEENQVLDFKKPWDCALTRAFIEVENRISAEISKEELDPDSDEAKLRQQNLNPFKLLSSGPEAVAKEKFFSSGSWRTVERVKWWDEVKDEAIGHPITVFGHYWRTTFKSDKPDPADVFNDTEPFALLAPNKKFFCVDYSVGKRYEERGMNANRGEHGTALAALRLPEGYVLLDDGRREELPLK